MHRLAALLLLVLAAASTIGLARAADGDTSRIILLFVVNPPDADSKKGVDAWFQLFNINIGTLLAGFSSGSDASASIKVRITRKNVDNIDQDGLQTSFGQQPSLHVLSTVGAFGGESTRVWNEIYLGEFKGSLQDPYVTISQNVIPFQYKITREALAAVTLYAYAMAVAKTSPDGNRFTVCRILDRANMYKGSDLDPDARTSLENLFQAISAELEARACGGKR